MNPPAIPQHSDRLATVRRLSTGNVLFVTNGWIATHGTHKRNRE